MHPDTLTYSAEKPAMSNIGKHLIDAAINWLASRPSRIHWFVLACCLVAAAVGGPTP
jgi:hypothetical protein